MDFLPKIGVCGTLYIFKDQRDMWAVATWDGKKYSCHAIRYTYEAASEAAASLLWAKDWPIIASVTPTTKMNPCVLVKLEFQDGSVQRLCGEAAQAWLKNVNDIAGASQLRVGTSQVDNHHWQFSHRDLDSPTP